MASEDHGAEKRMKWYGHVRRREARHMLRRMAHDRYQEGDGEEDQTPEQRLMQERDLESVGLKAEDVTNMTKWKTEIRNHSGDHRDDGNSQYQSMIN